MSKKIHCAAPEAPARIFLEKNQAQLNIENIFNKGYWASADANNNLPPSQSRTVRVKLIANF